MSRCRYRWYENKCAAKAACVPDGQCITTQYQSCCNETIFDSSCPAVGTAGTKNKCAATVQAALTPTPSSPAVCSTQIKCNVGDTTCSVGSLFSSTCFVNHYKCNEVSPVCNTLLAGGLQSASLSSTCGTEQIDLYCAACGYVNSVGSAACQNNTRTCQNILSDEIKMRVVEQRLLRQHRLRHQLLLQPRTKCGVYCG